MSGGDETATAARQIAAALGFGDSDGYSTAYWEIYPRQELKIGRAHVEEMLGIKDPTISNEHISIRCVQFDEDTVWGVPPVIYVENLSSNKAIVERFCIDEHDRYNLRELLFQGRGAVPFHHRDKIYLNERTGIFVELQVQAVAADPPMASLMEQETKLFGDQYEVTPHVIGVGGHGTVYIAIQYPGASHHACKVVPLHGSEIRQRNVNISSSNAGKEKLSQKPGTLRLAQASNASLKSKLHRLEVEYDILKDLDHVRWEPTLSLGHTDLQKPNIITVRQVFITTHHIYIMQELITGGDLLSLMDTQGPRLGEPRAAVIVLQVLRAVEYLHDNGVVHRDIKPDNILVSSWESNARVVLTDFGQAKKIGSNRPCRMFSMVGTVGYTAPEVYKQNERIPKTSGYSCAVDMWSIGTITAVLLTGNVIFAGSQDAGGRKLDSRQAKLRAAAQCDLSAMDDKHGDWARVGRRGKAFVKALLVLDESERMTAKQALRHPFINCQLYADSLREVCERASRDWKPRVVTKDIVQRIDTSDIPSSPPLPSLTGPTPPIRSAYFNSQHLSSQRCHDFASNPSQHGQTSPAAEQFSTSLSEHNCGYAQPRENVSFGTGSLDASVDASYYEAFPKL